MTHAYGTCVDLALFTISGFPACLWCGTCSPQFPGGRERTSGPAARAAPRSGRGPARQARAARAGQGRGPPLPLAPPSPGSGCGRRASFWQRSSSTSAGSAARPGASASAPPSPSSFSRSASRRRRGCRASAAASAPAPAAVTSFSASSSSSSCAPPSASACGRRTLYLFSIFLVAPHTGAASCTASSCSEATQLVYASSRWPASEVRNCRAIQRMYK